MSTIIPFLRNEAFDQSGIHGMSLALEHVCVALGVNGDARAREAVAIRVIELARRGERNWVNLRDRVLNEANGASLPGGKQHEKKIGRVGAD